MKKQLLFGALSLAFISAGAQAYQWAKAEGKYAYDYGYGITNDNAGNVYVVGKYEEAAVFSGSVLTNSGNHDGFLAKYSPSGSLIWAKTAGGPVGDYWWHVTTDRTSFVAVCGEMEGYNTTITFPGSSITLNSEGDNGVMFAKYDLDGNLLWAKSEGGIDSEKALSISHDSNGNIYIAGYYSGNSKFNGTPYVSTGNRDIFVAKYNSSGAFQWFRHAGSTGRDEAKSVKVDASGNVYIAGIMSNNCTFESQTLTTYNNTNYFEAFLAKYDTDGTLQWVKTAGGDWDDVTWGIAIDNAGKIYVAGEFNAYAEFGGPSIALTTSGRADVFVACYDANGAAQWAKKAGGTWDDRARGIGTNGTHIFITGQFGNPPGSNALFGGTTLTAADSSDIFSAALDNAGNFIWASSVDGPADVRENLGYESGNAITAFGDDVYSTGGCLGDTTQLPVSKRYNMFGSIKVSQFTRTDAFITKQSHVVGLNEYADSENISVFPNPSTGSFVLNLEESGREVAAYVYNSVGSLVSSSTHNGTSRFTIDLAGLPDGVYLVEIKSSEKNPARKKIILQH